MNKTELITAMQEHLQAQDTPVKRAAIEAVLDAMGTVITLHLVDADAGCNVEVALPGLGKLKTSTRAARTGRNPQSGAEIQIPSRIVVKFAAAKALDDALNPT